MRLAKATLIWAALAAAICVPIAFAAASPQLAWRGPVYILAGFAGIIALGLLLVQPLLIGGYLPGLQAYRGRPGTRLVAFLAGGDYSHRSVRLAAAETPVAETGLSGETALHIPLELPAGLSTVVLVVDEGRGELDAREPVTVVGLRLAGGAAARSR